MSYIMAYAAPVPDDKKDAYREHSTRAARIFRDHGATRVVECWGDSVPPGDLTSFPLAVQAKDGETVVFGWQEWPDKATHDAKMQDAMKDPRFGEMKDMPLDGKRMIFAGFEVLFDG